MRVSSAAIASCGSGSTNPSSRHRCSLPPPSRFPFRGQATFEADEHYQITMQQAIGIDMSKSTFHAAFDESIVHRFANNQEGFASFLKALTSRNELAPAETTIGNLPGRSSWTL
jgi:hypothetical protein